MAAKSEKKSMSPLVKLFWIGELAFAAWLVTKSMTATERDWAVRRKVQ